MHFIRLQATWEQLNSQQHSMLRKQKSKGEIMQTYSCVLQCTVQQLSAIRRAHAVNLLCCFEVKVLIFLLLSE